MTTSASRGTGHRPVPAAHLPWLAGLTGSPKRSSDGALAVSGWVVGPDERPVPTVLIAGRSVPVELERLESAVAGLPADWPAWRWLCHSDVVVDGPVDLVVSSPGGDELLRRDGLTDSGAGVSAVRGLLDTPAPDSVVQGDLVLVTGWLLLNGELPARVDVEVDGAPPVNARLMLPRPDVAELWPDERDAGLAGYEARVPVRIKPGESRRVTVRVTGWTSQGAPWTAPVSTCTVRARAADVAEVQATSRAAAFTERLLAAVPVRRDPNHLLIFGHSLRIGGGELWLSELLTKLVQRMKVTLVSPSDGPLRPDLEALGVDVWVTGHHRIQEAVTYESYVSELALLARASGAGVVMVNTLGCFAGADAALRAGLPVAWVIHESFSLADFSFLNWGFEGLSPLVRQRWEQCLAEASALLFVADATRELFLPYSQPRRCLTTRYGIDLAQAEHAATEPTSTELRRQLGVPADARVLLTVGVSEPRKGHGQLLVAFERIHRMYPDAHLIIVGMHDSPYCDALRERVRDRGLSGSVSLIPLVRDPQAYFRIADLFVNSSDIESLPRSILEAIAFRIPVLAADVFGAREVITDGESGWLFSPNDLNALTVALLRALDTPAEYRSRMAERARKHVDWFLDSSHYGEEYATILGRLADPDGSLEGQSA